MVLVRVLMLVTNSLLLMGPGKGAILSPKIALSVDPDSLSWTEGFADQRGTPVVMICSVSGLVGDVILQTVKLQRSTKADPSFKHVTVAINRTGKTIQGQNMPELSVSYTAQTNMVILRVAILAARCEDAGTYRCLGEIISLVGETAPLFISDKNLREVNPDLLTLTSDPEGVREWTEGQTLRLTCYAAVGSLSNVSDPQLVWQIRKNGEGEWSEHKDTNTNTATIETAVTDVQCIKRWSSTMTITLTTNDTGREYGCFLTRNDSSVDGVLSAVVHSFGTVNEGQEEEDKTDLGVSETNWMSWVRVAVSSTAGFLAGLGIAALLFRYKKKRRKTGERMADDDDGDEKYPKTIEASSPDFTASGPTNDVDDSSSVTSSTADISPAAVESSVESSSTSLIDGLYVGDSASDVESSDDMGWSLRASGTLDGLTFKIIATSL